MSDDLIREARELVQLFGPPQSGIITRLADALEAAQRDMVDKSVAWDKCQEHLTHAKAAEAQAERLAKYAKHERLCAAASSGGQYPCDCGLDEALATYEERRDGQG